MNPPDNPYQASPPQPPGATSSTRFISAGVALLVCGVVGVLVGLVNIGFYAIRQTGVQVPPPFDDPAFAFQIAAASAFMGLQSLFMIAGAVSMFARRRRWLALVGAWAAVIPMCGCYVLPALVGLGCLVVLYRRSAQEAFTV